VAAGREVEAISTSALASTASGSCRHCHGVSQGEALGVVSIERIGGAAGWLDQEPPHCCATMTASPTACRWLYLSSQTRIQVMGSAT